MSKSKFTPPSKSAFGPVKRSAFNPVKRSAFDPVKRSAFDPVKRSAFDPVRRSKWSLRKESTPCIEIEYLQCTYCQKQIKNSKARPLCGDCVEKLKQDIMILRMSKVCPRCGYSKDEEWDY